MPYRIGIDAGSKTVKLVVTDETGRLIGHLYWRHHSDIRHTLICMFNDFARNFGDFEGPVAVTGSAGIAVAQMLGLPFVQEVIATTHAAKSVFPQTDAIIELGGEDAKIMYLTGNLEQRMNATCAGGTGGFIDTIAFMLGVDSSEMDRLASSSDHLYPIASRCAVFAQSDVRPLLNSGASKEDVAASALEAVVRQTLGGLAGGRPIQGNVMFLGGPFEFIPELAKRFSHALGLDDAAESNGMSIRPKNAHLLTAIGAALIAGENDTHPSCDNSGDKGDEGRPLNFQTNTSSIQKLYEKAISSEMPEEKLGHLPPLFSNRAEREEFIDHHASAKMPKAPLSEQEGPLYLGFDAGSTTLKYALVNERGELVASAYEPTHGDVLGTAVAMLDELYLLLKENGRVHIGQSVAIGYGAEMLRSVFSLDADIVETSAHLRGALAFCPDVDFVLDIGGQDMKALWVEDGRVVDAVLNEACSSGCGAFVEGTGHSLKKGPGEFAATALLGKSPIDLGTKCTVFMTSRVRHAQKAGASKADIASGVAYSVVQNALYRMIGRRKATKLGNRSVVQGGTFKSNAVLRAFELISDTEVIRPDTSHLMGAIGAALIARDHANELRSAPAGIMEGPEDRDKLDPRIVKSRIIGADELLDLQAKYGSWTCTGCSNSCLLSVIDFGNGKLYASGNRCPKGELLAQRALESNEIATFEKERGVENPSVERPTSSESVSLRWAPRGMSRVTANIMKKGDDSRQGDYDNPSYHDGELEKDGTIAGPALPIPYRHTGIAVERLEKDEEAPDLIAFEQKLLSRYLGTHKSPDAENSPHIGIVSTLNAYENLPFWHTLLSKLGFSVSVASHKDVRAHKDKSCESIPSEGVCEPAKLSHAQIYALKDKGVDSVFMPNYLRKTHCAVSCEYALAIEESVPFISDGTLGMISPHLDSSRPSDIANNPHDTESLFEDLEKAARNGRKSGTCFNRDAFSTALESALEEQESFEKELRAHTQKALDWLKEDPQRHGILVAARPYHLDPDLIHDINRVLQELGFVVFSMLGIGKKKVKGYPPPSFKPAKRLLRGADFAISNPQVDMVIIESFNCGFDAASMDIVHDYLAEHDRPFTALKIDEIVDTAHIKIRLRTMAEAITQAKRARLDTRVEKNGACSRTADPERSEGKIEDIQKGSAAYLLDNGISDRDLDTARADIAADICFTAAAMAAHAVNMVRDDPSIDVIKAPYVCKDCLIDALPSMIERACGRSPEIEWVENWDAPDDGSVSSRTLIPQHSRVSSRSHASRHSHRVAKIGIVGNPLLCFDPYMNEGLLDLLDELGADVVLPDPERLFVEDVRYLDQLAEFEKQGVDAVLYLQSFSCLKCHVHARGSLHQMTDLFPDMPVTVIDYDPESSALNRENRIRLAVEAARIAREEKAISASKE